MIMKIRQLFIVSFLTISYIGMGQEINNTLKKDNTNIYYDATYRYFTSKKGILNKKIITVLFEESYFTQFLPNKIENVTILVANPYNKKLFKKIRKEKKIEMLKISPLKVTPSGKFKISIIYFNVSNPKRKNLHFENKAGVDMIYTYDSSKKQFVFDSIEN